MKLHSPQILKAFMQKRDFSMSRLAHAADCSKAMIGYLVAGEKNGRPFSTCSAELAERIAEALGVPTEAVFERHASAGRGRNNGNRLTTTRKAAA